MSRSRALLASVAAAAAVALLPAGVAVASTGATVALTEEGERYYFFDDTFEEGGVPVTPGSTLTVPAPPQGTAWETGVDLVLFDLSTLEPELDAAVESLEDGEPEAATELGEALVESAEEIEPDGVVAGPIEEDPSTPGGVRVTLDAALPEGEYVAGFLASGTDAEVAYFVTLAVTPGEPVEVVLDYAASFVAATTYVTTVDLTVAPGSRVTFTAPPGRDLTDFEIELLAFESDPEAEPLFYLSEDLNVSYGSEGSSVSITVPADVPSEAELFVSLFLLEGDFEEGPLTVTAYEVLGLRTPTSTEPSPTASPSTSVRIPTAVPAGEGPVPGSGAGPALWMVGAAGLGLAGVVTAAAMGAASASRRH